MDNGKFTHIPDGLYYINDYITNEEETQLIDYIDSQQWDNQLKRRVQHYGYRYNYKNRSIGTNDHLGTIPKELNSVNHKLCNQGYTPYLFDQLIVNEYVKNQGISKHVDCIPCFNDHIVSLTLGCGCMMVFKKRGAQYEVFLEPRSLVILSGSARYKWTHEIPPRHYDVVGNEKIKRDRRISLTYRKVILYNGA